MTMARRRNPDWEISSKSSLYAIAPKSVIKNQLLSDFEMVLYMMILALCAANRMSKEQLKEQGLEESDNGTSCPQNRAMYRMLGCTRHTLIRGLQSLHDKGMIHWHKQRKNVSPGIEILNKKHRATTVIRSGSYARVPLHHWDLPIQQYPNTARRLWITLCMYANDKNQAHPSIGTLQKIMGCKSRNTIKNNLKKLRSLGLIKIKFRRGIEQGNAPSLITLSRDKVPQVNNIIQFERNGKNPPPMRA